MCAYFILLGYAARKQRMRTLLSSVICQHLVLFNFFVFYQFVRRHFVSLLV